MAYPVIDAITLTPTVVNATTYVVNVTSPADRSRCLIGVGNGPSN